MVTYTHLPDSVHAGAVSAALVAGFGVLFLGGRRWVEHIDTEEARLDFIFVGVPCLVLIFVLFSGWVLTKFRLVPDLISANVAAGSALLSLYVFIASTIWPGYEQLRLSSLAADMLGVSMFAVPVWLLYICAVGFARRR